MVHSSNCKQNTQAALNCSHIMEARTVYLKHCYRACYRRKAKVCSKNTSEKFSCGSTWWPMQFSRKSRRLSTRPSNNGQVGKIKALSLSKNSKCKIANASYTATSRRAKHCVPVGTRPLAGRHSLPQSRPFYGHIGRVIFNENSSTSPNSPERKVPSV